MASTRRVRGRFTGLRADLFPSRILGLGARSLAAPRPRFWPPKCAEAENSAPATQCHTSPCVDTHAYRLYHSSQALSHFGVGVQGPTPIGCGQSTQRRVCMASKKKTAKKTTKKAAAPKKKTAAAAKKGGARKTARKTSSRKKAAAAPAPTA